MTKEEIDLIRVKRTSQGSSPPFNKDFRSFRGLFYELRKSNAADEVDFRNPIAKLQEISEILGIIIRERVYTPSLLADGIHSKLQRFS